MCNILGPFSLFKAIILILDIKFLIKDPCAEHTNTKSTSASKFKISKVEQVLKKIKNSLIRNKSRYREVQFLCSEASSTIASSTIVFFLNHDSRANICLLGFHQYHMPGGIS